MQFNHTNIELDNELPYNILQLFNYIICFYTN